MSSKLHQAVELAQAGQRDEARRLLWEYLQTNPDQVVAWLWLAAVAADQPEYVRALNEVLRIEPGHPRARQLLDDFYRQYGDVAAASTPPFARDVGTEPPPYAPPQSPPQSPPPAPPSPAYQPPPRGYTPATPESHGYEAAYVEPRKPKERPPEREPEVVRERVVERRGRRGCGCLPGCGCLGCGGCWQSCFVAVVLLILLPAVLFGVLSYASFSLGPLDWPTAYLPDKFGMKTLKFESGSYEIRLDAPRSWYLVSEQNDMWLLARDVLNEVARFRDEGRNWEDFEDQTAPVILETDPIRLNMSGDVIKLELLGEVTGGFRCDTVGSGPRVTNYGGGLCGTSTVTTTAYNGDAAFASATAPAEWTTYTFTVPVDDSRAVEWQIELPGDMVDFYDKRIDTLIESMQVKQK